MSKSPSPNIKLFFLFHQVVTATSPCEDQLRQWKQWVRDVVNERLALPPFSGKTIAKACMVCTSGTHRCVAGQRLILEMCLLDGLAVYHTKHLSRGLWQKRHRCWSCPKCNIGQSPPPLATGYFMESGIGYSHSQSHL